MAVWKTILVGLAGALLASPIPLPLSELFAAAFATIVYLRCSHQNIKLPDSILTLIQLILGMSIGITVPVAELF